MKIEKTRNLYIEPRLDGKPTTTSRKVLQALWDEAGLDRPEELGCISGRPGKGRTKLVVTVSVEEVPA